MNIGRFSKDEQLKKEPDERLTPSVEVTSSEAPTVSGTNLDNEVDQKDDGKNIILCGSAAVGKSSWISKLSKKVAASGREEEEARTAPSQRKTTKPKSKIFLAWGGGDSHWKWTRVPVGNFERNP